MLNPSTADASVDDPTIRRCIKFSNREGAGSLVVVNLFARRCTRPVHLLDPGDPVGPDNDQVILGAVEASHRVVFAWGASVPLPLYKRIEAVQDLLDGVALAPMCLGRTASGAPRHPLYVKGGKELEPYDE